MAALKRLALISSIVAVLAAAPGVAQGAPAPKQLGETATAATSIANCACTAIQFADTGTAINSYAFPYSGVITKSGFYVGEEVNAADWVQMRSFSHSGTNRVTVTGDGTKHMLQGLPSKSIATFYERLPVSALGVLGARYSIASAFIEATPTYFTSPSTFDAVIGTGTNLAVGDSWEETPAKNKRVNVEAVLEPDEDHDTYGDVSQDLCPGSPIGGGPCSGALFGSGSCRRPTPAVAAAFSNPSSSRRRSMEPRPPFPLTVSSSAGACSPRTAISSASASSVRRARP